MGQIRVVFDTNIIISAIGFGGRPLDSLLQAFDENVQLVASEETLAELERVFTYEHLPFTTYEQVQYPAIIRLEAEVVEPKRSLDVVRDSDDDKFIECAIAGEADYIVSGDKDLREVGSYDDIKIITAAEFLSLFD
ncbi:putative toxin-antitoxin system toxin component, PIN family [Halobacteriaceae bacterium SHR40]|uniref:putative toxin-antitoxin system toxin component, PIN family n=1 Tax=Halovenus amylolytica TaxID=2500550 RepID=UPI000FE2B53D